MKLHRNLALGIHTGLVRILNENQALRPTLERLLMQNRKWGSRDRKLLGEAILEITRWKRKYTYLGNFDENDPNFLWKLIGIWFIEKGNPLPDWKDFTTHHGIPVFIQNSIETAHRKIKASIPDWLDDLGVEVFEPPFWENEINAQNQPAPLVLRCNTLKCTKDQLQKILQEDHDIIAESIEEIPHALVLSSHQKITHLPSFKMGWFEVQDANSQRVAEWLAPTTGSFIVDACAGAGGKTLHLASMMSNSGKIHAIDVHEEKLKELTRRADRNGVTNISTHLAEDLHFFKKNAGKADGVLIDAPCSGLGTLRRNPAAKWHVTPEKLLDWQKLQQELLLKNAVLVKPNGVLIYATCSIFPQENNQQIITFLKSNIGAAFVLEKEKTFYAHTSGFDGFYIARMVRNNEL